MLFNSIMGNNFSSGDIGPMLAKAGTIIVIGVAFTAFSALVIDDWRTLKAPVEIEARPDNLGNRTSEPVDITNIDVELLFGSPQATDSPASIEAPTTRLDLTLVGTFTGEDENSAYALIKNGNNTTRYHLEDQVAPGVVLAGIRPGKVLLSRNGAYEQLVVGILKGTSRVEGDFILRAGQMGPAQSGINPDLDTQISPRSEEEQTEEKTVEERIQALRARQEKAN